MDDGEDSESFKPRDSAGEADEFLVGDICVSSHIGRDIRTRVRM